MTENDPYTAAELLAVMSSRLLEDGQTVFAGVGIPLLAATLAQRTHAPGLTILFEGGTLGPFIVPGELPPSTNEQRCTRKANMVLPITDVMLLLQRGYIDIGFMGGAQIDPPVARTGVLTRVARCAAWFESAILGEPLSMVPS